MQDESRKATRLRPPHVDIKLLGFIPVDRVPSVEGRERRAEKLELPRRSQSVSYLLARRRHMRRELPGWVQITVLIKLHPGSSSRIVLSLCVFSNLSGNFGCVRAACLPACQQGRKRKRATDRTWQEGTSCSAGCARPSSS